MKIAQHNSAQRGVTRLSRSGCNLTNKLLLTCVFHSTRSLDPKKGGSISAWSRRNKEWWWCSFFCSLAPSRQCFFDGGRWLVWNGGLPFRRKPRAFFYTLQNYYKVLSGEKDDRVEGNGKVSPFSVFKWNLRLPKLSWSAFGKTFRKNRRLMVADVTIDRSWLCGYLLVVVVPRRLEWLNKVGKILMLSYPFAFNFLLQCDPIIFCCAFQIK